LQFAKAGSAATLLQQEKSISADTYFGDFESLADNLATCAPPPKLV
jgi:hypothetical protein